MALTLPDLNLGHIVGRQVFSPLHHPLLSSVPHQILACLCSPEILMQAFSEKNQVPPTNTPPPPHPPSLIMIFFSSGSVQSVAGLRTKLHVNPARLQFLSLGRFLISFVSQPYFLQLGMGEKKRESTERMTDWRKSTGQMFKMWFYPLIIKCSEYSDRT